MPNAGAGVEAGNAGAAGAQLLGERALRRQLQLELARQHLALELLVLADVGGDHLRDLPGLEQQTHAEIVHAGVVADDGQALDAALHQRLDQVLGNAAQAEAAGGDRDVVPHEPLEGGGGGRIHFLHLIISFNAGVHPFGPIRGRMRLGPSLTRR